ncbi:MAG: MFS transporter [Spirochaetes bacterium]|nr:MFS transporter [Spirochaetota bacterium]
MDAKAGYRVYGYRWVVLAVYFLITVVIQMQWLSFAPIAREARVAYGVTAFQIDLLSMIYMGVFLIVCFPASYLIDRYGIRIGVGIGAILTGIFGLIKGVGGSSYAVVVAAQTGLAVAQPFILNSVTKVAVHWFPINERATAVGLATLAQFVGIITVMIATPFLIVRSGVTYSLGSMLMIYGAISAASALLLLIFMRESPPTPPGDEGIVARMASKDALRHILANRDMRLVLLLFFIGLGMFNAISTCIDQICEAKGLSVQQTGMVGGMMLIAGTLGGILLPPLSDRLRKRKPFILLAMVMMTPGLAGLTFADSYGLMLASSAVLGFFLLGAAAPVGFQYSAEVSYPAPESLSQGIILFAGQISGILFIVGMNGAGMIPFLIVFLALAAMNIVLSFALNESPRILSAE